jgi:stearoyl-CoA desaturase (delta-9 desaturase)
MSQATLSAPAAVPGPARAPLLSRPSRSAAWVAFESIRGTWFLIAIHVGALCLFFTGATPLELLLVVPLSYLRGLMVTVGYHRYFSHRSFKTSRAFQFVLAFLGCANMQRGPLWWAAIHRYHHLHSDDPIDSHSPVQGGFFWAHCGWVFASVEQPDLNKVRDFTRYPELVWLERLWLVPGLLFAGLCYLLGGWSMVCADFCLSAVITLQMAFLVNSLGHMVGWRRYPTPDDSRNSLWLALLTLGDGWHHNHHHYPHSANHGFFPGEIDTSHQVLCLLARLGVVWDLRKVPPHKLHPPAPAAAAAAEGAV